MEVQARWHLIELAQNLALELELHKRDAGEELNDRRFSTRAVICCDLVVDRARGTMCLVREREARDRLSAVPGTWLVRIVHHRLLSSRSRIVTQARLTAEAKKTASRSSIRCAPNIAEALPLWCGSALPNTHGD